MNVLTVLALVLIIFMALAGIITFVLGIIYLLSVKEVREAVGKVRVVKREPRAVLFTDEPKTEEEEAIEREERILKTIGSEK